MIRLVQGTRKYSGQSSYKVRFQGVVRELPLVQIQPHIYIASDAGLILGDVEFISKVAELLATRIPSFKAEVILTPEAKSIALAFELARRLGLTNFMVARKSTKAYMGEYFSQKVKSITTESEQQLLLTVQELRSLSGRRVCLLDDVVSTGATFKALESLVKEADGEVVCKAAVWKEGPWYREGDLVFLGPLPVFLEEGSSPLESNRG